MIVPEVCHDNFNCFVVIQHACEITELKEMLASKLQVTMPCQWDLACKIRANIVALQTLLLLHEQDLRWISLEIAEYALTHNDTQLLSYSTSSVFSIPSYLNRVLLAHLLIC